MSDRTGVFSQEGGKQVTNVPARGAVYDVGAILPVTSQLVGKMILQLSF